MLHYFSRISDLLKKNSLAVILIFAAIVRLTLFLSQSGIIWADSTSYYLWAVEIAETFTFTTYPFYRTPFYSMFLSPFLLFGESILAGRAILLAQYTLGVLTVFYLYKIARLYFSEKVAFLAAMLFSLDVLQLYYETVIQTEVLFCFLLVLTSYQSLVLIEKQDSKRNLIFLGISIGLLTLTRPIGRLFFIVVLICSFIKNKNFKNTIKKGGIIFTFYYLTILPWQIINYHTYNHWGLSLDMGINLFH
ncbi:MAG: glycosyltransferase family 39 protein, partial [Proteobacteria bacterium]|nr:glycosyltransferase family 39 protein [Pseudomonadota bacterium]